MCFLFIPKTAWTASSWTGALLVVGWFTPAGFLWQFEQTSKLWVWRPRTWPITWTSIYLNPRSHQHWFKPEWGKHYSLHQTNQVWGWVLELITMIIKNIYSLRFALGNSWNRQFFDSVFNLQKHFFCSHWPWRVHNCFRWYCCLLGAKHKLQNSCQGNWMRNCLSIHQRLVLFPAKQNARR